MKWWHRTKFDAPLLFLYVNPQRFKPRKQWFQSRPVSGEVIDREVYGKPVLRHPKAELLLY